MKILSHNVFWFQGVPFLTDQPKSPDPEVLQKICALYRRIDPDLICLQEIQDEKTFHLVSECLDMEGSFCPGKDLPQYGGAVFWLPGLGKEISNSNDSEVDIQRMRQTVEITGPNGSICVCNIHLPSERQLGPDKASAQRRGELQDAVKSRETGPDIITGDFNERPGGPTNTFLKDQGYIDAALLFDCGDVSTNISSKRGDYIWVKKMKSVSVSAYKVKGKEELVWGKTDKEYLSDHLPLWITLE